MVNQYLTLLRRSVGLTTLAAMLSWALLVDALELLGGKPPHHGKVSFNRGGDNCIKANSNKGHLLHAASAANINLDIIYNRKTEECLVSVID